MKKQEEKIELPKKKEITPLDNPFLTNEIKETVKPKEVIEEVKPKINVDGDSKVIDENIISDDEFFDDFFDDDE